MVQHHENAEDITQEVFIEVFRSIGKFRGESRFSTWLYRITIQKSLEHIRNSRRKKRSGIVLSLFGQEHKVGVTSENPFYHPGVKLENREQSAILFRAIALLPENQKTAFILHKVEGLPHTEIAEIMNNSIPAVESLIVRAKSRLKSLLSDWYNANQK
jgi:RNA polymerase sigma-70 factor (ECF subfamily)